MAAKIGKMTIQISKLLIFIMIMVTVATTDNFRNYCICILEVMNYNYVRIEFDESPIFQNGD